MPLRRLAPALSSALVAAAFAAAALAAEPVFPPGSRIGLEPLAGMEPSRRFTGFEDAGLALTLVEMPAAAYRELAAGFTAADRDAALPRFRALFDGVEAE
jgi:hypothetical protein